MPTNSRLDETPDGDLFNNIRHDDGVFKNVFAKYFSILCTYTQYKYHFDLDLAKEAVHSSFIRLWETRQSLTDDMSVKAYLYKIVNNSCISIIRHQNVKRRHEEVVAKNFSDVDFETVFQETDARELQSAINNSVSVLPDKMREIFEMSRHQGLTYSQIARQLGISVKTVETQMGRALARLRVSLKGFLFLVILVVAKIIFQLL